MENILNFIKQKTLQWAIEKSITDAVTVEVDIKDDSVVSVYKSGRFFSSVDEIQRDELFSVTKENNRFTLDYFLDPESEGEIFLSIDSDNLEVYSRLHSHYTNRVILHSEEELLCFLQKHFWAHSPGYLY